MDGWLDGWMDGRNNKKIKSLKKIPSFGLNIMCVILEIGQMIQPREEWNESLPDTLEPTVNKGQSAAHPGAAEVKPPTSPISRALFSASKIHQRGQVLAQII